MQTCRRHPSAGRFMANCSGCTRELYDMQARNEAMAAARSAIATMAGTATAEIIEAKRTHTGHLIVATRLSRGDFTHAIDVFREATDAETDPELIDPRPAGSWVLVDQWGAYTAAEHAEQMQAARDEYAPRIDLAA